MFGSGGLVDVVDNGDPAGAVKFRPALGPVGGGLKPAGPRGGDLGGGRAGERSLGVDRADSRPGSL